MNMKKAALPSLAVLLLMGCDAATDAVSDTLADAVATDPAKRISSLLRNNDPSVCAEKAAIQTALGAANSDYSSYLQNGGDELRVDATSATEIKKDIHEITCSSTIHYKPLDNQELSQTFRFKLRPNLGESGGFVAEVLTRSAWRAIGMHMDRGKSLRELKETLAGHTNRAGEGDNEQSQVIMTKLPFANDAPDEKASASHNSNEEYSEDCLILIRGTQRGGRKCQADSNGRNTFYFINEDGYVQFSPDDPSKKIWTATWYPEGSDSEELGSLRAVGDCLKNDIATIC